VSRQQRVSSTRHTATTTLDDGRRATPPTLDRDARRNGFATERATTITRPRDGSIDGGRAIDRSRRSRRSIPSRGIERDDDGARRFDARERRANDAWERGKAREGGGTTGGDADAERGGAIRREERERDGFGDDDDGGDARDGRGGR
jgi:hypothetical protein